MSLKSFHFVFIVVSILLAFGFGYWSLQFSKQINQNVYFVMAIISFICGIGLIAYEIWFLKKTKNTIV